MRSSTRRRRRRSSPAPSRSSLEARPAPGGPDNLARVVGLPGPPAPTAHPVAPGATGRQARPDRQARRTARPGRTARPAGPQAARRRRRPGPTGPAGPTGPTGPYDAAGAAAAAQAAAIAAAATDATTKADAKVADAINDGDHGRTVTERRVRRARAEGQPRQPDTTGTVTVPGRAVQSGRSRQHLDPEVPRSPYSIVGTSRGDDRTAGTEPARRRAGGHAASRRQVPPSAEHQR